MRAYLDLVRHVLEYGVRKENRTGVATLSCFGYFYKVNLEEGYPLLTTKKMHFDSMLYELLWYLSGEGHIRSLQKHTKIWNNWANDNGELETAYGRFWRRYPVPRVEDAIAGECWGGSKWIRTDHETGEKVFDQIDYVIDSLKDLRKNPTSRALRRLVVTAWHPVNATGSRLPPCHYTFCFNVTGEKLNCHLTQRSGDIALGIPFNLACYALLTIMIAKETGFSVGEFAHTIVDAHIYENHIDGLREQLTRTPKALPRIEIADKPFNDLCFEDIRLIDYASHPAIEFPVAV